MSHTNREKRILQTSCKQPLGWACSLVQMGRYYILKIMEIALLSISSNQLLLQSCQILDVQVQCLSTLCQNRQKLQVCVPAPIYSMDCKLFSLIYLHVPCQYVYFHTQTYILAHSLIFFLVFSPLILKFMLG